MLVSLTFVPIPLSLPFRHSPSPSLPSPYKKGPLNPAKGSGKRCKLPQQGLGRAPAEIECGAF